MVFGIPVSSTVRFLLAVVLPTEAPAMAMEDLADKCTLSNKFCFNKLTLRAAQIKRASAATSVVTAAKPSDPAPLHWDVDSPVAVQALSQSFVASGSIEHDDCFAHATSALAHLQLLICMQPAIERKKNEQKK
jgi:hypothetical protein